MGSAMRSARRLRLLPKQSTRGNSSAIISISSP